MTISRRDNLHQKLNNLSLFLESQFPDKKLQIGDLKTWSDDNVISFIVTYILPYRSNLNTCVDNMVELEKITPSKECRSKLIRYMEFFVELVSV